MEKYDALKNNKIEIEKDIHNESKKKFE